MSRQEFIIYYSSSVTLNTLKDTVAEMIEENEIPH